MVELEEVSAVQQEELAPESAMVELELEVLVVEPVMVELVLAVQVDSVRVEEQVVLEKQVEKVDIKDLRIGLKEW